MTLGRSIFPEKVNALTVVFIVSISVTASAMAQILPTLPENLIEERGEGINLFSLGYGARVANYMCFESLKGNLVKSEGDEILADTNYGLKIRVRISLMFLPMDMDWKWRVSIKHSKITIAIFFLTSDQKRQV